MGLAMLRSYLQMGVPARWEVGPVYGADFSVALVSVALAQGFGGTRASPSIHGEYRHIAGMGARFVAIERGAIEVQHCDGQRLGQLPLIALDLPRRKSCTRRLDLDCKCEWGVLTLLLHSMTPLPSLLV
jgi:hypothetical protein